MPQCHTMRYLTVTQGKLSSNIDVIPNAIFLFGIALVILFISQRGGQRHITPIKPPAVHGQIYHTSPAILSRIKQ
jgi:hypothetical protein